MGPTRYELVGCRGTGIGVRAWLFKGASDYRSRRGFPNEVQGGLPRKYLGESPVLRAVNITLLASRGASGYLTGAPAASGICWATPPAARGWG